MNKPMNETYDFRGWEEGSGTGILKRRFESKKDEYSRYETYSSGSCSTLCKDM